MTKISSTAPSTGGGAYPKIRSGFHFRKEQPSESHVLVHAYDSSTQNPKIFTNDTAIPTTGDFNSTPLFTNTDTSFRVGSFSDAPNGQVTFADGKDTLIWGGDEMKTARFINFDPDDAFEKDFTKQINNTSTGSNDIATLTSSTDGVDARTVLLIEADVSSSFNDQSSGSGTIHTVNINSSVVLNTTDFVIGDASAEFGGSSGYLFVPDHADFTRNQDWNLDFWVNPDNSSTSYGIYSQWDDANNYFALWFQRTTGITDSFTLSISARSTGGGVRGYTLADVIYPNRWQHIEVNQSSCNLRYFVDGLNVFNDETTQNMTNLASTIVIGAMHNIATGAIYRHYDGKMDAFRVSSTRRHSDNFTPQTFSYTSDICNMYLGSVRPLKGFKTYIGTGNTSTGELKVKEWNGTKWSDITNLVDNTSSGNVSFKVTGTVTFDSTVTTSKPRTINDLVLYWYNVGIENLDNTTTVTYMTENAPMQQIGDIWDGEYHTCLSFRVQKTNLEDNTANVLEEDYDSGNNATFADITSSGSDFHLLCGFQERMMGIEFLMVGGNVNVNGNVTAKIEYWNGIAWVNVGYMNDGTAVEGTTLAKSGVFSWTAPEEINEFVKDSFATAHITKKVEFSDGLPEGAPRPMGVPIQGFVQTNQPVVKTNVTKSTPETVITLPLYYYKITFNGNLTTDVRTDRVAGIPAPKNINGYNNALMADERLFLIGNSNNNKNTVLISALKSPDVYNGFDSVKYTFGTETEVIAGEVIYNIIGSNIRNDKIFFKKDSVWGLAGNSPETYSKYPITSPDGLAAKNTLKKATINIEGNLANVLIWQGFNGLYIYNNRFVIPIHRDIRNFFDKRETSPTRKISTDFIDRSDAFLDEENSEYHWLFADASSTGKLNREFALDLNGLKWFEVNRGSSNNLQVGIETKDVSGNSYVYGTRDTGHLLRLENGNNFDGNSIDHEMWFGDMALDEGKTKTVMGIRKLRCIEKSTTSSTGLVTNVTHYVDTATTASSTFNLTSLKIGKRLNITETSKKSMAGKPSGIFHSFKFNKSTTGETVGFTPIYITGNWEKAREDE